MRPVWTLPPPAPIEPMPPSRRPAKVWKHLYDAAQHWERLCGQDVGALRATTEAVVGILRADQAALPPLVGAHGHRARALLDRHHEAAYAPAYRTELAAPETVWAPGVDALQRQRALTPGSVLVVVQHGQPGWVVTAFRPHPPTRGVEWEEADFRRHGAWYFSKETGMKTEGLVRATAENLQRASAARPGSVRDVWWLASAVGYGRLLADHAEVRAALPAAENVLGTVDQRLLAELRRSLDWDGCLERLVSTLKHGHLEDAEEVLAASEELLAVASAVEARPQAEAFCARVEALIAWLPAEWLYLVHHAAARGAAFGTPEGVVHRLWAAVEGAAVGAAMREMEPAVRPAARLVDALLPAGARWLRWLDRVAALAQDASTVVARWVVSSLDSVRVVAPAPVMGGAGAASEPWEVRGRPAPDAPACRVFVVDAAHADGYEVTERFTAADGDLWRMDPGDAGALVVLVAGRRPLCGVDLAAVLAEAAGRADVFVGARRVSPPT